MLGEVRGVVGLQSTWIKVKIRYLYKKFTEELKYFNGELFGEF